jgi:RimJ/RimL family protein N-acetyltransferase
MRRWTVEDGPALSRSIERNAEHLRPWMPWIAHEPLDPASRIRLIETWDVEWRSGGDVVLGVFMGGEIVGGGGLHRRIGPNGLEIGYWVDRDRTRQGVATEIARLLTTSALGVPGITCAEVAPVAPHQRPAVSRCRAAVRTGSRNPE